MSRRLTHISLVLVLLLSSEVWAIGLGDIQLDSALNQPLRAEISLLSATPDELQNLTVSLASADTFARYGIDRPFYLQDIEFKIVRGANGSVVQIRSRQAMTEPFLTFLVEASWPSGRLLREYTVLLDPPTFAPPAAQQAPAVTAPSRSAPADSGRIERQAPVIQSQPSRTEPAPSASAPRSIPAQPADDRPFDASAGGDYVVQRSETLWGIASRVRPDSRLTMNQTMLAIFEANRDAFGGNINVLRAGAALRIPSADEIVRISSGNAFAEVKRQNEAWSGGSAYTAPPATVTRPSLTLVPPDEEPESQVYDDGLATSEPTTREDDIEQRIYELESADVADQPSLIQVRDDELATLRQELAEIRGEVYEPPVEVSDDPFVDGADEEAMADETAIDDLYAEDDESLAEDEMVDGEADAAAEDDAQAETAVTRPAPEPGLVDRILGALTSIWAGIGAALIVVIGLLVWFMRRDRDDDGDSAPWEALDSDEQAQDTLTSTESMRAPTADEAFVVVEEDSGLHAAATATAGVAIGDDEATGEFGSLEDTFSSETAVNLDQTDPIAEADFHMAYGLYDQAADLINGALESQPDDTALMSKLCEIYFVWGNRDAFVDAASKLKASAGGGEGSEWDKIVIMGQQIAADHALFAGAGVAGATKAVDLAFEADSDEAGALDMDFGGDDGGESGAIDLGSIEGADDGVDFFFEEEGAGTTAKADDAIDLDLDITAESPTIEASGTAETLQMPTQDDATAETPTIEQPFGEVDATSELPSLDESLGLPTADAGQDASATAEINLDDLDLGIGDLDETELASLDDLDATGTNEVLTDVFTDTGSVTGKNPEIDPNATGVREGLDLGEIFDLDATGEMNLAADETGRSPLLDLSQDDATAETEVSIDDSLLDATGLTQVLSDDMAVETGTDVGAQLGDDEATMLASLDDDADEFDFAKTEALPADAFPAQDLDETGEMPAMDADLDLDDLTAALKVSEAGDTIEQLRDDATVEQPRPSISGKTAEVPTMSLGPEEMSDDLHEARTMTEVGTKLDLARAYVDMGDPAGARSILEEVLDEGDDGQRQQAQQLLDSLPS